MKNILPLLTLLATCISFQARAFYPAVGTAPLQRIAFGSCNRQHLPQTHWSAIAASSPDLWIWMGDNIYGDTDSMDVLREKYASFFTDPHYASFRKATAIVGTWDDHDYGRNDAGREYEFKDQSQRLLLDFLEEPQESPRRSRRGVYESYAFGPRGRQVQIILLDLRYHRDMPGPDADLLGKEQWAWLKKELTQSRADLKLIVSSTPVLLDKPYGELWRNFPRARTKLFSLIRKNKIEGVVFLSGDKHLGVLDMLAAEQGVGYPLHEAISSGLTHVAPKVLIPIARWAWGPGVFAERNYGTLEINWEARPSPLIHLELHATDGYVVRSRVFSLDELRRPNLQGSSREGSP